MIVKSVMIFRMNMIMAMKPLMRMVTLKSVFLLRKQNDDGDDSEEVDDDNTFDKVEND